MQKIISAKKAVQMINDGDVIALSGAGVACIPDKTLRALKERYDVMRRPRNLTLIEHMSVGCEEGTGTGIFTKNGMLRRIISGSFNTHRFPSLAKLILNNKIEAYNFSMGQICNLFRAIGARRVGAITDVGIGTFIDPRMGGGKLNDTTKEELIELIELENKEQLFFKSFPINIAIIRGSIADEKGNISLQRETVRLGVLDMALAAKNSSGKVIVEVERTVPTLDPRIVEIPHCLVDVIVVNQNQQQTKIHKYDPSLSGEINKFLTFKKIPTNFKTIILRRAAKELNNNDIVNVGFGLSAELPLIAMEEEIIDNVTFTIEQGTIGGLPAFGVCNIFPAAYNMDAKMDMPFQFLMYEGGRLDITFLGMGQFSKTGDVNVSKFGKNIPGCGGLPDITHNTKKIVFCGTFTSGGLECDIQNEKLKINKEGKYIKFVEKVEQITFSGKQAVKKGQKVIYITERGVFRLTPEGIELCEVAPGIELEKNIMQYTGGRGNIKIASDLKIMDKDIFKNKR